MKIIADSCCDLTVEIKPDVALIPLTITVGETPLVDDGSIDTMGLIRKMKECPTAPNTACPSPGDFADAMAGDEDVFAVTMSRHVSGTYQSAVTGSKIKQGNGRVYVFDSKSASAGQALIVHRLFDYIKQGLRYEEIVAKTEEFIENMSTFFVLESLDNLIKNGRMNRFVGHAASIFGMRPIMGAVEGKIVLVEKVRGTKNAMAKLANIILERASAIAATDSLRNTLYITQCNCAERAEALKTEILRRSSAIKNITIVPTGGLSTTYANDGGIIVAY